MQEYTYSEARQRLADLLELAQREGGVRIRRRDGSVFLISQVLPSGSPLDVVPVDLQMTRDEILAFIREGHRDPYQID
ncbi:MAG: type II toxin-antitoxin system Phd/YefM family antitoxin [Candidatus Viridilinea halotolerans]|uniref:Type II toxin-antitoxin system Phd/YefM family antitoxin n=1 Tax=Candidatus Viridilinea halotolerans TaxID=2491704 RepID=A0A426U1I1_9CHLR|nr:MAG: type II toxin-antitoxin system Phd/YefM family antitoxin [Candidatus Viridilinea halotolerans]